MIQFVSAVDTAAREMGRVTKKGGTVATCVWDNSGGLELAERFWDAAIAVDPGAKRTGDRRYGSPSALSDLWTATGFANVETRALVIPMEFTSFEDLWGIESNAQGPIKLYISTLSEDRRQALKERLRGEIFGTRPDGPFMLQAKAWAVKGTVPRD